jgi:short-subunit dehydrogenase involved in D-alanine esterification of teichoic acids
VSARVIDLDAVRELRRLVAHLEQGMPDLDQIVDGVGIQRLRRGSRNGRVLWMTRRD